MPVLRTLTVICSAGAAVGLGHLTRCRAVAQSVARRPDWRARVVLDGPEGLALARAMGVEAEIIAGEGLLLPLVDPPEPEAGPILVDLFRPEEEPIRALRARGYVVGGFRDGGHGVTGPLDVDVDYVRVPPPDAVDALPLWGPSAFPARPEILAAVEERSDPGAGLVLCLGGGDQEDRTPDLALALSTVAPVSVVLGGGYRGRWAEGSPTLPAGSQVLRSPEDLPRRMARAAVAITAGGGMSLEFALLGRPMVVLPQCGEQRDLAETLERAGAAVMGPDDPVGVVALVTALLADPGRRTAMGHAGRALVDGRGAERVAAALIAAHDRGP
jgi:spore coat polysaccharide biosynthesis predicted glycosyltransferase SpsG